MATVERRIQTAGRPARYRVRWWASERQRSKTFDRYEDARRFKAMLEGDLANGTYIDPKSGSLTLEKYAYRWFDTIVHLRPSTRDRENLAMRHVIREFGTLPLSGVTFAHVSTWIASQNKSLQASSVRRNAFTLKRIMESAVHEGLVRSNPTNGMRLPAITHQEQRFLDREQINKLLEVVDPRYKMLVALTVYGGFRFGEITALRRSSVDVVRSSIKVTHTLVDLNGYLSFGPPKTKTSVRSVIIPRSVMSDLVLYMDKYVRDDPEAVLFTHLNGNPLRRGWFRKAIWLPATSTAGLSGLRFHDLRHTFVSMWVSLGRNAKEVSRMAGHSSVAFTLDRYGHLYEQDSDGLADALDRMLA